MSLGAPSCWYDSVDAVTSFRPECSADCLGRASHPVFRFGDVRARFDARARRSEVPPVGSATAPAGGGASVSAISAAISSNILSFVLAGTTNLGPIPMRSQSARIRVTRQKSARKLAGGSVLPLTHRWTFL